MADEHHGWCRFGIFQTRNPYGVLVVPGHTYVVDAGAKLSTIMPDGSIVILAFFPNNVLAGATRRALPGPMFLYIGTLALVTAFSSPSAKVYRLDRRTPFPGAREHSNDGCGFDLCHQRLHLRT